MALSYLVAIGGTAYTDDGRTFSEKRDERAVDVELASGKIKKYIKSEKRTFTVDWDHLPISSSFTSDARAARNDLRAAAHVGATTTVTVRNQIGSTETYTVFVEDYSEEMLRRDPISGNILYRVHVELREQ